MSLKETSSDTFPVQDCEYSESSNQSVSVSANITCDKEESSTPISDPLEASVHSTHSYKGVEYSMVSPVPEDLTCAVCHEVLNDPHQTECGHLFCRVCLDKAKDNQPQNRLRSPSRSYYGQPYNPQSTFTCPLCRSRCDSEGFEDKHVDRHVKSLAIRCNNEPCPWEGTLGRIEDHKSGREGCRACQYEEVECSLGCGEKMMRKDLDHHCQFVCQLRPQSCKHCRWMGTSQTMRNHYQYCTEYPLQCPNECGESGILKRAMQSHLDECQEHSVGCPYKDLGCLVTVKRSLLSEHTQDAKDRHLQLSLDRVCQLSRIIMESSLKVPNHESLCTPQVAWLCNTAEFPAMPWIVRLNDVSSRKSKCAVSWLSEPIYTAMSGYKFRFSVYAGGGSKEYKNYISIFTYLHCGPNDSILSWPFKRTVKLTLLNQLEDRCHHMCTVNYTNATGFRSIIQEGKPSTTGWGKAKFIEYSQLGKKQDQNCQYLKDDCLFFKVDLV